jgi:hypothetical protein
MMIHAIIEWSLRVSGGIFIRFVCNDGILFAACCLLFYHSFVYQYCSPVQPIIFTSRIVFVQRLSEMGVAVTFAAN